MKNDNSVASDTSEREDNDGGKILTKEPPPSSLLERIRAQQQQKMGAAPSKSEENAEKKSNEEYHPLSSNKETDIYDLNSMDGTKSFLPTSRMTITSITSSDRSETPQQSIFPSPSSTMKKDADPMSIIQTAPYTYASPPNPPVQVPQPSTKFSSRVSYEKTDTISATNVFNTMKDGVSSITNKVRKLSRSQDTDPYRYALLGKNSSNEDYSADVEDFGYAEMDGNRNNMLDEEDYSMKVYFLTFCNDIYGLTLGRLSPSVRKVVVALLVVLILWFVIEVL